MIAFLRRHSWWLVPLLVVDVLLFRWLLSRSPEPVKELVPEPVVVEVVAEPVEPAAPLYGYPTDQLDLWNTESTEVYQPTASGRVESALFGSTRTGANLLPLFHMGIDIAPMRRDRQGRPQDAIYAVREGRVAYINRVPGNSNYGIYIVLVHPDPVGEIYTLYAHLASVEPGLRENNRVERGDTIGVMGNTMSTGLPMVRAHLHFEIGIVNNQRFNDWYRTQQLPMVHGTYHGHNLTGIDPLALYGTKQEEIRFSMLDYLRELPPAFTLIFRASRTPDYFRRYPGLWQGASFDGEAIVMTVSEAGVPLSGRTATPTEVAELGRNKVHVLAVDEEVIGRNGRRHVVKRGGRWEFGRRGPRWLEILTY
jgi:peptidoglycan LD-endopeptidase LytH